MLTAINAGPKIDNSNDHHQDTSTVSPLMWESQKSRFLSVQKATGIHITSIMKTNTPQVIPALAPSDELLIFCFS
jgi:hypothetical protein